MVLVANLNRPQTGAAGVSLHTNVNASFITYSPTPKTKPNIENTTSCKIGSVSLITSINASITSGFFNLFAKSNILSDNSSILCCETGLPFLFNPNNVPDQSIANTPYLSNNAV